MLYNTYYILYYWIFEFYFRSRCIVSIVRSLIFCFNCFKSHFIWMSTVWLRLGRNIIIKIYAIHELPWNVSKFINQYSHEMSLKQVHWDLSFFFQKHISNFFILLIFLLLSWDPWRNSKASTEQTTYGAKIGK